MRSLLLAVVACSALCCGPKPPPPPPPQPSGSCVAAQEKLLSLQCQDEGRLLGGPNRHGVPFDQFCQDMIDKGIFTAQQVQCLSNITDCKQVDAVCSWGN